MFTTAQWIIMICMMTLSYTTGMRLINDTKEVWRFVGFLQCIGLTVMIFALFCIISTQQHQMKRHPPAEQYIPYQLPDTLYKKIP